MRLLGTPEVSMHKQTARDGCFDTKIEDAEFVTRWTKVGARKVAVCYQEQ